MTFAPHRRGRDSAILMARDLSLDGAVLDMKLLEESIFPVCRRLRARGVPFLFMTGSKVTALPAEFQDVPMVAKPFEERSLREAVLALLPGAARWASFNVAGEQFVLPLS